MVAVLGGLNVFLTWRHNHGIFYHCFFVLLWPVFGRYICFHSFPVCCVQSNWRQAFFSFLVPCYAILSGQALGIAWGFSAMPFSAPQRPYTGFLCLALCTTIATYKRLFYGLLWLIVGPSLHLYNMHNSSHTGKYISNFFRILL